MRTDFAQWRRLWHDLAAAGDPQPWHRRLVSAYREETRHYHNLQHIAECLTEFDRVRALVSAPLAVEAALWFHDAVYDPRSGSNEEDSAAVAVDCLAAAGVASAAIDSVRQLILCTKTHEPGAVPDAALLIDIDLAILGQPTQRFWEYEHAIRAEYAWVPAATFAEKRAEILAHFLARPAIYRTASFRLKYEVAARANLQAAIARLQNPPA
jgi:predicted metal-dependent HD superfamily phosphohydrolase